VRSIKTISGDIDQISDGHFSVSSDSANSRELEELSQKVAHLGKAIQTSQNNLENQHNQLNGILAYMTDGVIATDRRGQVILANNAALHFLASTEDEILKKNIAEALNIDNYYAFRDLLEKAPELDLDSENSYGEYIHLKVNFSIFRRESGYISGIIAVLHDVTDAERLERERRLFVSNVAHELRTPLTTIKSYLETLDNGALSDADLAPDFIKTSLHETDHMSHMISDLLVLSRIDQDRLKLDKEVTNLVAFLTHELARFSQILADNQQLKLDQKFSLQPIWMEFDTDKMRQVIDNLLSNAVKYSPDGGTITISVETTDTQVLIKITDEGIGIPRDALPKIFDRFYRVDKARNHDQGGTGLGLAIVYDMVKLHGGNVFVRSKMGKGSEFTVALPYYPLDFENIDDDESWEND
jgi:two-component system sensor histidine kinase VicK